MQAEDGKVDGRILTFQAGGGFFGIPLKWVVAVRSSAADQQAGEGDGSFVPEGEKTAFFDLNAWLGKESSPRGSSSTLLLGQTHAVAAAAIDRPGRVVEASQVYEWPKMCRSMAEGIITGVMKDRDQLVLLVDPEALLRAINKEPDTGSQGGERL